MNVICMSVIDAWRKRLWPTCQFLFDECIAKPVRGVIEIGKGLILAEPDLADALTQAIASKLSPQARDRVQQGFDHIATGWVLVRVPLVVLVLIAVWGWKGLVGIGVGSLLATAA
ncbi:hypothetical protein AYO44_14630 [Planctomycetaceae bacterium SCGC AG-212-F19]|nr:hypothetical protein AYO44_14630 [Planctomycetaceae bacterium SCGC AG-212-F19]